MFKSPSVSPCLMVKSPVSTSFQVYLVTHHFSWFFTILDCKSPVLVVKYCEIMFFFPPVNHDFFSPDLGEDQLQCRQQLRHQHGTGEGADAFVFAAQRRVRVGGLSSDSLKTSNAEAES